MPQRILNEDWEDYNNRKIRDARDRRYFSCEEPWEVGYLIKKIKKHKGSTDQEIKNAIASCRTTAKKDFCRMCYVKTVIN